MEEEKIHLAFHRRYAMEQFILVPTGDICLRPVLLVRLGYGSKLVETDAMIDTGADYSAFPRSVATDLGIPDYELIPTPDEWVTSKGSVSAWYCTITITLADCSFDCRVLFLDVPGWDSVIGREPVFSQFKFAFRQSIGEFYISLRP